MLNQFTQKPLIFIYAQLLRITLMLLFMFQLWLALSEKHLQSKGVNWNQTEKLCFNEWSNPDDSELGVQIVKVSILLKI